MTLSLTKWDTNEIGVDYTLAYIRNNCVGFASATSQLNSEIEKLASGNSASLAKAKEKLFTCRANYKKLEFFLEYFLPYPTNIYNRPVTFEIEDPLPEYQSPIGLQVIEQLLYGNQEEIDLKSLKEQAAAVADAAQDLRKSLYGLSISDSRILESIRLEMIRIATLGITGYDTPASGNCITETNAALGAVQTVLQPYLQIKNVPVADTVDKYLNQCLHATMQTDFNSFDRLAFLHDAMLPLQNSLGQLIKDLKLEICSQPYINYNAPHIFSRDFLTVDAPNENALTDRKLIAIGKKLFFDPILSANHQKSCASCHQPGKFFTDKLAKGLSIDNHTFLKRNTPGLLYAAFQRKQFWDGRVSSLEDQVTDVITNSKEMNGDTTVILQQLNQHPEYSKLLQPYVQATSDNTINMAIVTKAIAAYERSLAPMNSLFDKYMNGQISKLTPLQKEGFNLFMGKAQCATCHFPPLFNSLLPPAFDISEFEVIGTPLNKHLTKAITDTDSGYYHTVPLSFTIQSFKVPTVRNIARTAPYMHNGAFSNLQQILDFYNKGGGVGIGIAVPHQTLSEQPLQLTGRELKAIKSFLHTLTDQLSDTQNNTLQP
ncbi:cytochrome c553 peroxidase [Filimonas lacunae]|nr:cytochrome c553 peroxidase [Filimonas lacunae]